ncbi:MAG: hypothetical protein M9913_01430 [Bryobacteraceae bacterium]|nr:hypothetical protein [Solibacteraceae bacterium]MCL4840341.1 hypothetical protein [Bryobacteraceae bacterium]MCO5349568.1 hypothetical protein [Bryobacteraceae bacterium]
MRIWISFPAVLAALSLGMAAAQPADLTGSWHLNVEKSRWGKVVKPLSVVLTIEHHEPQLDYHGAVQYANEETREFSFSGSLDGEEYAMSRSFGDGMITLRRIDPWTVESTFRSSDGRCTETAQTTIARSGKTLTRRLTVQSPAGRKSWTEHYERR